MAGRPRKLNRKLEEQILELIADGLTIRQVFERPETWPFDTEQYILLNVAIQPSIDQAFTQSAMEIDYVRVYQETTLSVADLDKNEAALFFPNPVEDKLTIQLPSNLFGAKATIYSVLGQKLNSFIQTESRMVLDISHYKQGIYVVRLEAKNSTTSYKIIKK